MSDAKAKAEARRAKILARATNKVTAVMPTEEEAAAAAVDDSIYLNLAETKGKERPLAARRSFISSSPMKEEGTAGEEADGTNEAEASTPTKEASSPKDKEGDDEKPEEAVTPEKPAAEKKEEVKEEVATTSSGKSIKYVAKSLEEIEREVAERTAAFDKKTLGGKKKEETTVDAKKDEVKDDKKKDAEAKKNEESDAAVLKKQTAIKKTAEMKIKQATQPVEPNSVLRFLRVLMIILLASYTGYRTVETSRAEAFKVATSSANSVGKTNEFDEFVAGGQTTTTTSTASIDVSTRTWPQYLQQRLTGQMECSVSAASLVWYLSRMLSPVVHAQYKQKPKQTKPLEMIMNFFTEGVNGKYSSLFFVCVDVDLILLF